VGSTERAAWLVHVCKALCVSVCLSGHNSGTGRAGGRRGGVLKESWEVEARGWGREGLRESWWRGPQRAGKIASVK